MTRLLAFLGRFVVTSLVVGAAVGVGYGLWGYYMEAPWTRSRRSPPDQGDLWRVTPYESTRRPLAPKT